jgi:transcriptional regulator with XRE-family HTH domain
VTRYIASRVGEHLDRVLSERKVTCKALAEATGLAESYLSLLRRGRKPPSLATVLSLQRALGLESIEDFLGSKESSRSRRLVLELWPD